MVHPAKIAIDTKGSIILSVDMTAISPAMEPSAMLALRSPDVPNTLVMLDTSATSPTAVDVPCPSSKLTLVGGKPARSQARRTAKI